MLPGSLSGPEGCHRPSTGAVQERLSGLRVRQRRRAGRSGCHSGNGQPDDGHVHRPGICGGGRSEAAAHLQADGRGAELLGLSWENVDFKNGVIYVKQQLQCKDGEYFFCTPKSGKGRTIAPASVVMDALHQQWRDQRIASMEAGEAWSNPNNLVFTDPLGKNLVRRTVVKHFKSVAQRVGIPEARFHDLRHPYVKYTTKINSLQKQKSQTINLGLIVLGSCFFIYCLSK